RTKAATRTRRSTSSSNARGRSGVTGSGSSSTTRRAAWPSPRRRRRSPSPTAPPRGASSRTGTAGGGSANRPRAAAALRSRGRGRRGGGLAVGWEEIERLVASYEARISSLVPRSRTSLSGSVLLGHFGGHDIDLVVLVTDVDDAADCLRSEYPVLYEEDWRD